MEDERYLIISHKTQHSKLEPLFEVIKYGRCDPKLDGCHAHLILQKIICFIKGRFPDIHSDIKQ